MIWGKRTKPDSPELQRYRSIALRDALELVRLANQAERESAHEQAPVDTATRRDLAGAHTVTVAEKVLTNHILLAADYGISPVQLGSEIIKTTVAQTVVGDLAWFALQRSVRDAERQRRRREGD